MQQEHELLTVPETAKFLRVQQSTVRAWVLQRRIPFVKMGRLVRIRKEDCAALIENNLVAAKEKDAVELRQGECQPETL